MLILLMLCSIVGSQTLPTSNLKIILTYPTDDVKIRMNTNMEYYSLAPFVTENTNMPGWSNCLAQPELDHHDATRVLCSDARASSIWLWKFIHHQPQATKHLEVNCKRYHCWCMDIANMDSHHNSNSQNNNYNDIDISKNINFSNNYNNVYQNKKQRCRQVHLTEIFSKEYPHLTHLWLTSVDACLAIQQGGIGD